MHKRVCSGTLFLLLMILMTATAFATEIRASERFISYDASLFAMSNGDLKINFSVIAVGKMDVLGANRIAVQRYDDFRWVTERTFTVRDAPEMQTTNASNYSAWITYEPNDSNANYRAVVTFYAKDSSGSSTAQATTK